MHTKTLAAFPRAVDLVRPINDLTEHYL